MFYITTGIAGPLLAALGARSLVMSLHALSTDDARALVQATVARGEHIGGLGLAYRHLAALSVVIGAPVEPCQHYRDLALGSTLLVVDVQEPARPTLPDAPRAAQPAAYSFVRGRVMALQEVGDPPGPDRLRSAASHD